MLFVLVPTGMWAIWGLTGFGIACLILAAMAAATLLEQ